MSGKNQGILKWMIIYFAFSYGKVCAEIFLVLVMAFLFMDLLLYYSHLFSEMMWIL